jgi:2-polyprenyl-3-methyl-5-hydroxy-6-metoxy-1,4-benzoquinol methylase
MRLFEPIRSLTPCNLCQSHTCWLIGTEGRHGQKLRTLLCQQCGLAWTDPTPSSEELEKFYVDDYREAYKGTFEPKRKHTYRAGKVALRRWNRLSPHLPTGGALLDVGSGGGEFIYLMRQQGYKVSGIEPNRGYGEYAKRELDLPVTISFIGQELPVEGPFQVITLFHVLEHLRDPLSMIQMLAQKLERGGVLVIEVPNLMTTLHTPNNLYHYAHLFHFSPKTLILLGSLCGLRPVWTGVTEGGDNVTVVLTPDEASVTVLPAENGPTIRQILSEHTTIKHYCRLSTHARFLKKQIGQLIELARVSRTKNQHEALQLALR